jgi:very-short-patch-repair endonuclease
VDLFALNRIARRQAGLFTRRQARACGLSAYRVRQRLRSGEWRSVLGTVLAPATLPLTASVRDRAAQLAVPGSVLAGPAAARCWDLPVRDPRTFLVVGPHANPVFRGAEPFFETIDGRDVTVWDGILITSRPRTVVDCLRVLRGREALDLLDRALQAGWIDIEDLAERVRRLARHRGAPRLVRLLHAVSAGSRSAGERLLAALLRRGAITGWELNGAIADERGPIGVGDVVFRAARVVIEVDGWAFHVSPDRFQRDRERQNRLVAAGWTVLRFTWRDLTERPTSVLATIKAILAQHG